MMLTGAFVAVTGSYYTDNVLLAAVTRCSRAGCYRSSTLM